MTDSRGSPMSSLYPSPMLLQFWGETVYEGFTFTKVCKVRNLVCLYPTAFSFSVKACIFPFPNFLLHHSCPVVNSGPLPLIIFLFLLSTFKKCITLPICCYTSLVIIVSCIV